MDILKSIGDFIQNQILGMKWLNSLVGDIISFFGIDISGRVGGSLQFFFYDVIKITILLCTLIFLISYIYYHYLLYFSIIYFLFYLLIQIHF